jgi:hypothetical protein
MQQALPEPVDRQPRVAAVSCPDCGGSLRVSVVGDALYFACRIGHSYGLLEVLAAKEERLENRLWTVVTAVEEMAALLKDLQGRTGPPAARGEYGRRHEALMRLGDHLRRLVDTAAPIDLGMVDDVPATPESAES